MKTILLFLFLASFGLNAQTSMSAADIAAVSGNGYETLLTNVKPFQNYGGITSFLQRELGMYESDNKFENGVAHRTFKKKILSGEEEQVELHYKMYFKEINGDEYGLSTKFELEGDWIKVVEFFCGFWSRTLNFEDVKPGEVVSTRFLSDIATLSFPTSNTAKITVMPAADYYGVERPQSNKTATFDQPKKPAPIPQVDLSSMKPIRHEILLERIQGRLERGWLRFSEKDLENANFKIYLYGDLGSSFDFKAKPNIRDVEAYLNEAIYIQSIDQKITIDTLNVSIKNRKVTITE